MRMVGAPDSPRGSSAVTPLTLSSPTKATLFLIMLWRCWAGSEHGITWPRPHDLRQVGRRAPVLKASTEQVPHFAIWPAVADRQVGDHPPPPLSFPWASAQSAAARRCGRHPCHALTLL